MAIKRKQVTLGLAAALAMSLAGAGAVQQAHAQADQANPNSHPKMANGDHTAQGRHDTSGHDMNPGEATVDHAAHQAMFNKPAPEVRPITIDLVDIELLDQEGRALNFAHEAVGNKLVALNIFYSTCTTICPVTSAIFAELQDRLGDRLEEEVRLISVTVDPTTDTPARLKSYASKHGTKPGWLWLTGQKRAVEKVLEGLGLYSEVYTDHPAAVLVGDPQTDDWHRFWGFPSPEQINEQLHKLKAARKTEGNHRGQDMAVGEKS